MSIRDLQQILNGDIFTHDFFKRHRTLLLLIAVRILIYIYAGFYSEKQQHDLSVLKRQLRDADSQLKENKRAVKRIR